MLRSRALPVMVVLAVAAGLTLGAAGMLDMLVRSPGDTPALGSRPPEPPAEDRAASSRAAGAERAPAPGPAPVVPTASPLSVTIGALGVSAPLVPVGIMSDGAMEIPEEVGVVGWYAREGRRISPGDPGTAVLAGHRDSRQQGRGALHDLGELEEGDVIHVVHIDGHVSVWQVDRTMLTPRDELPTDALYRSEGAPQLAIVTCGGRFERSARSYTHNVIVIATPAQPRSR
jgi:hypothetical protein